MQWALARADAAQRAHAHEMFGDAIASALAAAEMFAAIPGAPDLRPHGVVDAPLRASIWREGVAQLIRPAAQALRAA